MHAVVLDAPKSRNEASLSVTQKRSMRALGFGGALEWFDWAIFGLLAAYIGPAFFPSENPISSTLSALAVFAVGFVARPIGGALLGSLADRIGRKTIMLWSIGMMAISSLALGLLPTYEAIGVWAGVAVLVLRIIQGVSAGVEAPLAGAYAVELIPDRPGYVAGYLGLWVGLGNLLAPVSAFIASATLGPDVMAEWGWRIPFILGGVLGFVVLYLRRHLPETLVSEPATASTNRTVWATVRKHWVSVLAIVFVVGAVQAYNYAWVAGMPSLAVGVYGEDPTLVFAITSGIGVINTAGAFFAGKLVDRLGKLSRWFVGARLLAIPTIFLTLLYSAPGIGSFAAVLLGGAAVLIVNMTLYLIVSSSLLPQSCRGTGVSVGYGIGVAAFGGTASYLMIALQASGMGWVFPVYVAALCAISVVLYIVAKRVNGVYVGE